MLDRVVGDGDLVLFGSTLERIETREVREIFLSVLGAPFFLAPDQRPQRHADQNQHQHDQETESCHRSYLSLLAEITKVHECRIGCSTYSNSASGWAFVARFDIPAAGAADAGVGLDVLIHSGLCFLW